MSDSVSLSHDSGALLALAAVSLGLITILSVWKLKQFKYGIVTETGGALFYGMLLGLTVRCLPFARVVHMETVESVCSCHALNSPPQILMVNVTSHGHCYRHVGKLDQRCPPTSETFDPEVLFNLFLPPIIFHGAYTLNQKRLIDNMGPVLTFAFLGTIISCMAIGACVYGFTRLMVILGRAAEGDFFFTDCLLFGAIMSATDPGSWPYKLNRTHSLISLAITTYGRTGAGHTFKPPALFYSVGYFLGVLVGSVLLGFIFAVITALISFHPFPPLPLLETSVFVLLSWSSFLSAEVAGLSGVVAVLCCGLSQARYTSLNLSSEGRTRTKQLFEVFNFLGEIFIFGYMGYILLMFPHHVFKALFISGAFLSIFISRACNIYPLSFLLNLGRANKIPRTFQHFMTFAGFRGAVALSLAIRDTSTEVRRTILTTTLLLVSFTVWVLGTAADPVLRCLDIRFVRILPSDMCVATGGPDTTPGWWHRPIYLKPVLTHCGPPPQWCGILARLFSSPHVEEDEEQLHGTEPDDSNFNLEKTENQLVSIGGDTGCEHQEDLVEGDLGLGTAPAPTREA
uniref:Solute carrier family 9 member A9 n=1 Tax=Scophthalmus maximus TaxID=52904 RepID=A0A8D3AMN8_SCOMX